MNYKTVKISYDCGGLYNKTKLRFIYTKLFLCFFLLLVLINRKIITTNVSIIIQSHEPDSTYPTNLEFKDELGDYILHGSLSYLFNNTTKLMHINTTLIVLDIALSAGSKWCSFQPVFQDIPKLAGEFIDLWSLETIPVEFKTTWDTRPIRKQWLGVISSPHITLSSPNPNYKLHLTPISVPYQFPQPDNNNIAFPCQLFMGKTGFELTALPAHIDGFKTWNWKDLGLTIQIHNDT